MSVIQDLEQELAHLMKAAEAKGEVVLADVYQEALKLEAKVKTEVVLLRQRAANLASDAEVEAEKLVIEAKLFLDKVLNWIKELEQKLAGNAGQATTRDFNTGDNPANDR